MDSERGLYGKYKTITRTDGRSEPGEKHDGCSYFVLDLDHDPHALAALAAYSKSCAETHPQLSEDLRDISEGRAGPKMYPTAQAAREAMEKGVGE